MPKRSTNFQDLVELLERQLAPEEAKVEASKLLRDSRSGENREVDIVIETKSGIHPLTIGIEVIEKSRPASSTWIEAISKKHDDLPIDKTIVVSRSGFYKPALKKASAYKIDALSLQQATELDWCAKIDQLPSVKIISFLLPYISRVTVFFTQETSIDLFNNSDPSALVLWTPSGEPRGSLASILDRLISDENVVSKIEDRAFTDAGTLVEGELRLEKGSYVLAPNNKKHEVHSIGFTAKCNKEETDAELLKGRYRDRAVAMASGDSFGRAVNMVFTEQKDGEKEISVGVRIRKK